MAYFQKLKPQALQSVAFGGVGASYATLGTILHDARIIRLVNTTDADVLISWNGDASTDDDIVPKNGFVLYDVTANEVHDDGCFIGVNTVFSVKRAAGAPSVGSVYLIVLYTNVS